MAEFDIAFRSVRSSLGAILLLGAVAGWLACDMSGLLRVDDRETLEEEETRDPDLIDVVVNGAVGNFGWAHDPLVVFTGLLSDELVAAFGGVYKRVDVRQQTPQNALVGPETSVPLDHRLHYARRALRNAAGLVAGDPNLGPASSEYRLLKALEGHALLALAENFCSAVPLSYRADDGRFVYGTPLTSRQLADSALARFQAAQAAGQHSLAAVGAGRALLLQGRYAEAAAAVAAVPTDYVWHVLHSPGAAPNGMFEEQWQGFYGLTDQDGGNGLSFMTEGVRYSGYASQGGAPLAAGDPRAPWIGPFDGWSTYAVAIVYDSYDVDVPLATGIEARLIEAEAELNDADADHAAVTAMLNGLRSDVTALMTRLFGWAAPDGLADLPDAATGVEARDQLFHERGFWLLFTGRRLADLRRLVAHYGLDPADVYPSGTHQQGEAFGTDVVLHINWEEVNNPNFSHDFCDLSSASID